MLQATEPESSPGSPDSGLLPHTPHTPASWGRVLLLDVPLSAVDLAASQTGLVGTTLEVTKLIPVPGPLQGSSSCLEPDSLSALWWLLPTTPLKWLFQDTALCHHLPNSYPDHKLD